MTIKPQYQQGLCVLITLNRDTVIKLTLSNINVSFLIYKMILSQYFQPERTHPNKVNKNDLLTI